MTGTPSEPSVALRLLFSPWTAFRRRRLGVPMAGATTIRRVRLSGSTGRVGSRTDPSARFEYGSKGFECYSSRSYADGMAATGARRTTRHRENATAARAETRRRLLVAAGEEFTEHGYHAATVKRIAARAGVTVQTLYLAWTSKATLLRAHLEAALAGDVPGGDGDSGYADTISRVVADAVEPAEGDPVGVVEAFARLFAEIAERAAPAWKLYRDAAAVEPDIADDWLTLQQLRRGTIAEFVAHLPVGALRDGLTPEAACDTAWVLASPATHELLVGVGGAAPDGYERWLAATLTAALIADDHRAVDGDAVHEQPTEE